MKLHLNRESDMEMSRAKVA